MFDVSFLLILIIIVALIFDFTNGAHDCANAIATVVSTKVLSPRTAVIMAATLNLIGAFLGTKVANTLGSGIVHPDIVANCQPLVLAALIGAIGWNLFTWHFGIPSSSSHALIGGLMGAAVAYAGFSSLNGGSILTKILLPLVLSPLAGFGMGLLVMFLIMVPGAQSARGTSSIRPSRGFRCSRRRSWRPAHGMNDAQKTMGVITLALFIFNEIETIAVPLWVKCLCAAFMALGTAMGGWKIVKTMGHKIFKLEPVHGFASETSAALVISGASLLGAPISTTHTITACIFGVGSTKRLTAVRWGVAGHLIIAWVLTIPASRSSAACSFFLLNAVGFA